ncbi:MAG: hypothetical protein NT016_00345 [Candidatus Aenigmarchaeota archaeon]|nr:hypothetical protein [Candidatus Aenigmarchaeota archaeon]
MRKDAAENLIKIVRCLKEAEGGWLWVREISRRAGMHHKTVSRLITKHLSMFIETQTMEPFNVQMIRLKPGTDVDAVFRFLTMKEKLDNELESKNKVQKLDFLESDSA